MTRKLSALLAVLALASCFGRVSAWAASPGDAHACCRGESSAPSPEPVVAECCAVPAAAGAVSVVRAELAAVLVEIPRLIPETAARSIASGKQPPPGPRTFQRAVPARAPPLA